MYPVSIISTRNICLPFEISKGPSTYDCGVLTCPISLGSAQCNPDTYSSADAIRPQLQQTLAEFGDTLDIP